MKVFEVTLHKNRSANECKMRWPSWWSEVVKDVLVDAYEDHPDNLGEVTEGAICMASDETWDLIAAKNSENVKLLSDEEANTKGRAWRPQVTKILDHKKVIEIAEKVGKGQSISAAERKALDPDDEERGLGRSPLFDVAELRRQRG